MSDHALTCEEAEIRLAALAVGDGPPSDEERALRDHIARCRNCADAGVAFTAAAHTLAVTLDPADPPARVRTAVLARVYGELDDTPAHAAAGDAGDRAAWRILLWDRIPAGRAWTLLGVLVAVLAGMLVVATRPVAVPASTLVSSPVKAGTMRGVTGEMMCDAAAQKCVIDVSGLPVPGAPGADGVAYEVWLHRNGAMVAATYLTLADDGRSWTATLTGDMKGVADVAMTLEPERGAGAPAGPIVATVPVGH